MYKPNASTCFHFTRKLLTLKSILTNGLRFSCSFEKIPDYASVEMFYWGTELSERNYNKNISGMIMPMICFCDIPLSRCKYHTKKYGNFGLGISKSFLCEMYKDSFNPVFYLNGERINYSFGLIPDEISFLFNDLKMNSAKAELIKDLKINYFSQESDLYYFFLLQLALCKPYEENDVNGRYCFYDEREWRMFCMPIQISSNTEKYKIEKEWIKKYFEIREISPDKTELMVRNTKLWDNEFSHLRILPKNWNVISHIIVKNERQRLELYYFIQEATHLLGYDIDRDDKRKAHLITKIKTMEEITSDF